MPTPLIGGMRPEFLEGYQPTQPVAPERGFFERAGIGIANAPATATRNAMESFANIFGTDPGIDEVAPEAEFLPGPGTTVSQKLGDFVGHGLAPMALELAALGRVIPKIPNMPLMNRITADAAGFGFLGAQQDRLTGVEQTGEGALIGALRALPWTSRIAPALALGAGSKAFFDRNGGEEVLPEMLPGITTGDVSGTLAAITGIVGKRIPWKTPLADHFATVAKEPLLLGDRGPIEAGYTPRLALEDRALEGQVIQEGVPQLRAGPGEVGADGIIYAGGPERGVTPEQLALQGRPIRPALTMEGGVVRDYSNITLPEMQARVPQGRVEPGATVRHFQPAWDQAMGPMEVLGPERPGFWRTEDALGNPGVFGTNALRADAPPIPAGYTPRPGLWSPQTGKVLTDEMFKWGEQFGIAREQMQKLDDAFTQLGIRDNNLKVQMMWDKIRNELKNVEADFNPQKGRPVAFPEALLQMDEAQLPIRARMAQASREELRQLQEMEMIKGKIGLSQGERQLLEAAQVERQRRAWQAQQLLRELEAAEPFKGKVGIPEGELQLAEQASQERARQRFIHEANARLLASLREEVPESMAQQAKGKTVIPEAEVQLGEQAALQRSQDRMAARGELQQDPNKGKLSPLREWQRSEGGSVLPEMLAPIARAGIGGAVGYAAGGEEGMLAGAALGLTPEAIKLLLRSSQKVFGGGKDNMGAVRNPFAEKPIGKKRIISTAVRVADDKLVVGETPFEAHPNLLMEALDNGADGLSLMDNMGFMAELNGEVKFVDRKLGALIAKEAGQVDPKWNREKLTSEDLREWDEAVKKQPGLRPLQNSEGGHVFQELNAAMSRAILGGLVGGGIGGAAGGSEGFLMGGILGAGALSGGPAFARSLGEAMANLKTDPLTGVQSKARGLVNLAKNFGKEFRDKSGRALTSDGKASDRFVRWLDNNLSITAPAVLKEALLASKGAASALLDTLDSALLKTGWFSPDEGLKSISNKFLDGEIDRAAYLKEVTDKFPGAEAEGYAKLITTARSVVDGLQKMVADGVGDPKMTKIINESVGQYLTRSYRLFTDKNWSPSQESIDNLVREMIDKKVYGAATPEDIHTMLAQYVREVKAAKGIYRMGEGKMGQEVSQQVLKRRKDLTGAWKEFLGEINDPTERIYQTVFRIRPMAEASNYFSRLVKGVKEEGWLPHSFQNYNELFAFETNLRNQADHFATVAKGSPEHTEAVRKLEKFKEAWKGQQNVENHPKFGSLRGQVVTRHVWDTLATYDNLSDNIKSPFLRGMMNAHTAIKLGRTALNPITVVRNFVTAPMFAAIGRATPHDVSEAWNVVMNSDHPLRKEIMEMGIGNVDQVKTEFYKEFENLTGGKYRFGQVDMTNLGLGKLDFDLAEKIGKRGFRHVLDAYRLPDNLIRIGTYLSAKSRIAQNLGKAIDDPEVLQQAARFTNRYTMNYDAVSPIVKKMRQLPFFNLFVTYTAEMMRILKNLGEDVIKGNTIDGVVDHSRHGRAYAAIPLAGLAVLPELVQSASESSLSPQDRAEWEKTKKLMPDYARTRYRAGIKREKDGTFKFQDFTPLIVSDSLNQMVKAVVDGDLEAAKAVNPFVSWENTPIWNIAREQTAGEDLRTGRKFRGQLGEFRNTADRLATVAREALPPWFPPSGSEWQKLQQATATNAEGTQGITNLRTGVRLTPGDFLQPYLTGVRGGQANPDVLQKRAISEAKQEMANETAYLNDVLNSDLPDDRKNKAVETFRTVVAVIQEKLRQRLETPSDRPGESSNAKASSSR